MKDSSLLSFLPYIKLKAFRLILIVRAFFLFFGLLNFPVSSYLCNNRLLTPFQFYLIKASVIFHHFTFFADANCLVNDSFTTAGTSDSFNFCAHALPTTNKIATGISIVFMITLDFEQVRV